MFKSLIQVIDNSGALLVECVNVLKNKVNNGWGSVGDEIVCVVKRARPVSASAQLSAAALKVRRGDVRRAVIVRTRKAVRRPDGSLIRFDDNAAVLLNNKREMLGTRIGGVVSADLRMKGWGKIVSLAPKVRLRQVPFFDIYSNSLLGSTGVIASSLSPLLFVPFVLQSTYLNTAIGAVYSRCRC